MAVFGNWRIYLVDVIPGDGTDIVYIESAEVWDRNLYLQDYNKSSSFRFRKLCQLHIDASLLTHAWPPEEKYELGEQAKRSSNSAPAQLAEKNDDRHIRKRIEGANRSRDEASETIHHLFMAHLKGYVNEDLYFDFKKRYKECIRMLNGLEKFLERTVPDKEKRRKISENIEPYGEPNDSAPPGWPDIEGLKPKPETSLPSPRPPEQLNHRTLNSEPLL